MYIYSVFPTLTLFLCSNGEISFKQYYSFTSDLLIMGVIASDSFPVVDIHIAVAYGVLQLSWHNLCWPPREQIPHASSPYNSQGTRLGLGRA